MFDVWRHHTVFLTSGFVMLQAESQHRAHAIVEQLIVEQLIAAASALAHLPSGSFSANAAWAVLWAIAHTLTRAAGVLAGAFHARATTATVRAHLINVPARVARGARRLTLHLPSGGPGNRPGPTCTPRATAHPNNIPPEPTTARHRATTADPRWKSRTNRRPSHVWVQPPRKMTSHN